MDHTCFNTGIATGPWPELSLPLSEEELDDLSFYCILEFGHVLNIPRTQQDVISAPELLPSTCTNYPRFDDPNDTALTPGPAMPMGKLTKLIAQSPYTHPDVPGGWPLPAQSLTAMGTNFVAPDMRLGGSPCTGMAPFTTHSMTVVHSLDPGPSSVANPAPSPEELTWLLEPEQSVHSSMPMPGPGGSSETGSVVSEHGANLAELIALLGPTVTSYPTASSISATGTARNVEVVPATTSMSGVAHGKCRRDADESYGNGDPVVDVIPPHKRVRGGPCNGNLEVAWSGARAHRTPDTRFPTNNNGYPRRQGAERRGSRPPMCKEYTIVPCWDRVSNSVGWWPSVQEHQLPRVEERVEEASHHMASTEKQEGHLFEIPSDFEEFRMLLAATEADWTRRAVDEIKCRLCPTSGFSKWDNFRRHCKTTEAHPLEISFCEHCGDFFARSDSLRRHLKQPPAECLEVTPEKAEEKRRETERVHGDFIGRVERSLMTGEEIGVPFAQIIKQMYPGSSKKRTRSRWE